MTPQAKAEPINLLALAEELRKPTWSKPNPTEFIGMVDKVIDFYDALDDPDTPGLDELRDARAAYRGPGIMRMLGDTPEADEFITEAQLMDIVATPMRQPSAEWFLDLVKNLAKIANAPHGRDFMATLRSETDGPGRMLDLLDFQDAATFLNSLHLELGKPKAPRKRKREDHPHA